MHLKLYESSTGKIHLVQGGRLYCKPIEKVASNFIGQIEHITCLNCKWKLRDSKSDLSSIPLEKSENLGKKKK